MFTPWVNLILSYNGRSRFQQDPTLIVVFRTRQLERCYKEYRKAVKAYGDDAAKRYILRINTIKQARDIEELMKLHVLRCHPLKGNRAGQYAVNITGFYRLIFSQEGEMLEIARIEEVSKHYGN